jgi:sulfatase modifying factor 1
MHLLYRLKTGLQPDRPRGTVPPFVGKEPAMKNQAAFLLFTALLTATSALAAPSNPPVALFPDEDPLTPELWKVVWPATPGLRYEVRQSTNLQTWTTAPGYPATATGPAQQMPFQITSVARFFQVKELDEQPPAIASQYPKDGGFAVPRFSDIAILLNDATGINTNSLQLTVGTLGTFTLASPQLTFSNNLLTFLNGGSIPLGGWGSNVTATLILADTLGHWATNTWSFDLEIQAEVVTNLFVFGSPKAQRSGQQIGNIPTRGLAQRFGPIAMGAGDPWRLELVASNRLELSYTNVAPGFPVNTYVCNLTPASPADIFNRKITALSDDPGNKRLTLFTIDVPLTEIATNAAVTISSDSRLLEIGTNGAFSQMLALNGTIPFPRIGYSLDGTEFKLKTLGQPTLDLVNLTLEEEHWWLTPNLQVGLEIKWGELKRFEAIATGKIESASVWDADFLLAGVAAEATLFDLPEALEPKKWILLGYAGPVPVFASLGFDVKLKGRAEVNSTLNFRAGKRGTADAAFGLTYNKPDVRWVNTFNFPPPEVIPFTASINAQGSVKVSLEPAVEFLVYGLAGVSAGITPSAGVVFELGTSQSLSGRLEADVSLDLGLAGPAFDLLSPRPELSLPLWSDQWPLFGAEPAITFTAQPQSRTVPQGGSAYFFCTVTAPTAPAYQWYFNNVPMSGQTARRLSIPSVGYGHAGNYHVRVTAGSQQSNSVPAALTVVSASTPPNMALIPAGSFEMGDGFGDWPSEWGPNPEVPVHTVFVSGFYMGRTEVTKAQWDEVRAWAATRGYTDLRVGRGKAPDHPVVEVPWFDVVKWCNAASERAGLTPVYRLGGGTVYRTGSASPVMDYSVNGYRLPSEAEWEKAARGGMRGQRFPWGNTISHSQANYRSISSYSYDISPTRGYHPTYVVGDLADTSPVGSFAPNGYGLYDMAGNVWEWCNDWWGPTYFASSPSSDPRGPASGTTRVLRGGGWSNGALGCRVAFRNYGEPDFWLYSLGFRVARSSVL